MGAEDERALMEATEVRGGRVLVVDDDPEVREAVETALELEGHRVTTAIDGLAASKRLGQAEFDAVVLDVLMPNMDGFEVCRRLRASGNRTPVLILTARDSEQDTIRGLDLGADDYLVKPFGLGELFGARAGTATSAASGAVSPTAWRSRSSPWTRMPDPPGAGESLGRQRPSGDRRSGLPAVAVTKCP